MTVNLELEDDQALDLLEHLLKSRSAYKEMERDAEGYDDRHAASDFSSKVSSADELMGMVRDEVDGEVTDARLRQR